MRDWLGECSIGASLGREETLPFGPGNFLLLVSNQFLRSQPPWRCWSWSLYRNLACSISTCSPFLICFVSMMAHGFERWVFPVFILKFWHLSMERLEDKDVGMGGWEEGEVSHCHCRLAVHWRWDSCPWSCSYSQHLAQGGCLICSVGRNVGMRRYAGRKATANSGADIIINEQPWVYVQVLLLISCRRSCMCYLLRQPLFQVCHLHSPLSVNLWLHKRN